MSKQSSAVTTLTVIDGQTEPKPEPTAEKKQRERSPAQIAATATNAILKVRRDRAKELERHAEKMKQIDTDELAATAGLSDEIKALALSNADALTKV